MSEDFHEMLSFVLLNDVGLTEARARSLAAHFADVQEFLEASQDTFNEGVKSITGKRMFRFSPEQISDIEQVQRSGLLSPRKSTTLNYLEAISRHFTKKQLSMVNELSLIDLTPNPFLISALGLKTPREVIGLSVYMRTGRSIVTSMGYFVQDLLLVSSKNVEAVPSGWDLLMTDDQGQKHWIQAKSGPNDMDKDQIVYWANEIAKVESKGQKGYIGITYGNRNLNTVSLGLMKSYLPNWEICTLIGRELWDFLADDPSYHEGLCNTLRESACYVLSGESFITIIENQISIIIDEFVDIYGSDESGITKYLETML